MTNYITPNTFTKNFYKDRDILAETNNLQEQILGLHTQRETQEAYAHFFNDFSWGMAPEKAEEILTQMGFQLLAESKKESEFPVLQKIWKLKGILLIAETQGEDNSTWFGYFQFVVNGTNSHKIYGGGTRIPMTLFSGDTLFYYSFASEPGIRPLLEDALPFIEDTWPQNLSYSNLEKHKEIIEKEFLSKNPPEKAHVMLFAQEHPKPLKETLLQTGFTDIQTQEGFLVTNHHGIPRFWKQCPKTGKISSYHGDLKTAQELHQKEEQILQAIAKKPWRSIERSSNYFQETGGMYFYRERNPRLVSIQNGKVVEEDYHKSKW